MYSAWVTDTKPLGPHMKKLAIHFMTVAGIPNGSKDPFGDGVEMILNPEKRVAIWREGLKSARLAVEAVMAAHDNPYGKDEEKIAEALVKMLEKRKLENALKLKKT